MPIESWGFPQNRLAQDRQSAAAVFALNSTILLQRPIDSVIQTRMGSQANWLSSGGGRRPSSVMNSNIQGEDLVVIDGQSASPRAEQASPTTLQTSSSSTSGPYNDLYQDASSPSYSDTKTASYTDFPPQPNTMNPAYHNPQTQDPTLQMPPNISPNPPAFFAQDSFRPFPDGQKDSQFAPMGEEEQQPPSQLQAQPQPKRERASPLTQPWTASLAQPTPLRNLQNFDTVSLRSLHTQAILGPDSWARPKPQPLALSLYLTIDTTSAARTDDIGQTFSYGTMAKDVISKIEGKEFMSIDHLTSDLASLADKWPGESLRIVAHAPKALLRTSEGLQRELHLQRRERETGVWKQPIWHVLRHEWTISGVRISCIIGVNAHERLEKQDVLLRIKATGERDKEDYGTQIREGAEMWRRLVRGLCDAVEPTRFQTLEALAALVARYALENFPFPLVTVGLEKPSALTFVEGAGVEITRDRSWLDGR